MQLIKVLHGYAALIILAREGVRDWADIYKRVIMCPFDGTRPKDVSLLLSHDDMGLVTQPMLLIYAYTVSASVAARLGAFAHGPIKGSL